MKNQNIRKSRPAPNIILASLLGAASLTLLAACGSNQQANEQGDPAETEQISQEPLESGSELSSEEQADYLENLEELNSEYTDYESTLPVLASYGVDGDEYHSGDTLSAYLDNGWIIIGDAYEESVEVTGETVIDPLGEEDLFLNRNDSLIQVGIINSSQTESRRISDCMLESLLVESDLTQSAESIAINGIDVYMTADLNLEELSENTSLGDPLYIGYYPAEGADGSTEAGADASLTGWNLVLYDADGDGLTESVELIADYIYE